MNKIDIGNLSNTFLIAVPGLRDPGFARSVVLICDHSKDGAFGLVINRLLLSSFVPLSGSFDIKEFSVDIPVYYGGPVKPEQGYVLYESRHSYYPSIKIHDKLILTTAKEILTDIALGRGPERALFILGFSGWAPGQLERELMEDSWLIAPSDNRIIFDTPVNERWTAAAALIGVDLKRVICRQGSV
jgi:putative transcriptional regulator